MSIVARTIGAKGALVGLDPDTSELEIARTRQLYDRLDTASGDAIPDDGASFDFVFSNSVLEHIDSLEPTLGEVARVLKDAGLFVFTVPSSHFHDNLGSPTWLGMFVTGHRDRTGYHREIDRRLYHLRYWDEDRWRQELARVGLRVVHLSSYMSRRETRRWALLSNATAGVLVRLIGSGRDRPIDVQRRLGIRAGRAPRWLRTVGRGIAAVGAVGLGSTVDRVREGSCILVVARKDDS
jgi:SAM-dependent methyltransferase